MQAPNWATHDITWNRGTRDMGVWVGEKKYQYYLGSFDKDLHDHFWGIDEWVAASRTFRNVKVSPVIINLENK